MSILHSFKIFSAIAGSTIVLGATLSSAQAATLTYNWADYDTNTYGSLTFNNQLPDLDPAVSSGVFAGAIVSFSLTNGGFSRTVTEFTENLITLTPTTARLTASGNTTTIPGGKFRFSIDLASILPFSDSLTEFDPTSSLWYSRKLTSQVLYADNTVAAEVVREMDEIKAVPEPTSSVALMLMGVLGALVSKKYNFNPKNV